MRGSRASRGSNSSGSTSVDVDPIRFVIQGDLHIAIDGVFLHRTKRLPPVDDIGVTPAAAFIAYCARARVIDAIKVGDWLVHRGHLTIAEVRALALRELWRPGAHEAIWILEHLDGDARSLPESEVRALLEFAGLTSPEVNVAIDDGPEAQVICDLVFRRWRTVVEHEGAHHQADREQYNRDLGRYAWMRRRNVGYVQSTHEKLRQPRTLVGEVFVELRSHGYDGRRTSTTAGSAVPGRQVSARDSPAAVTWLVDGRRARPPPRTDASAGDQRVISVSATETNSSDRYRFEEWNSSIGRMTDSSSVPIERRHISTACTMKATPSTAAATG